MSFWHRVALSMLLLDLSSQSCILAQDFAIRTKVFEDGGKEPRSEHLTVFQGEKIYDFALSQPETISIFDTVSRQFVLADRKAATRTALSADDLIRFAADEQSRALKTRNTLVRFAADPTFEKSYDPETGKLLLTSKVWDYEVHSHPVTDSKRLQRYNEFANWFAYLNAMFTPFPPALRLELNRSLDQHGCLPDQVLVRVKQNGRTVVTLESRHEMISELTPNELQHVKAWEKLEPNLKSIEFVAYRQAQLDQASR